MCSNFNLYCHHLELLLKNYFLDNCNVKLKSLKSITIYHTL